MKLFFKYSVIFYSSATEDEEENNEHIIEIINRRKLYKLEAKRAKLEEERLSSELGESGKASCSSEISVEKVNKIDECQQNKKKEAEVHERLRRKDTEDEYSHVNFQSGTRRRIYADVDNLAVTDCQVEKLKCETDFLESKHRSDYSVLFKIFGLFITFSSLGFFMIFQ